MRQGEADTMTERTPDPMLDLEDPPGFTELRDAYSDLLASRDTLLSDNKRLREALDRAAAIAEASGFTSDDFGEAYAKISTHIDTDDLAARVSNRYNIILAALTFARDGYLAAAHEARAALSPVATGRDPIADEGADQ